MGAVSCAKPLNKDFSILKMKSVAIFFCLVFSQTVLGEFLVREMKISDESLEIFAHGNQDVDHRSDQLGAKLVAEQLRNLMTTDHVKIVVDKGDVLVKETYPNEGIATGHSCSVTAEARSVVGTAYMIAESTSLGPDGISYNETTRNDIAVSEVKHALSVDLEVRATFGSKVFHHCHHWGHKTCRTDGYSEGLNRLTVNLAASNVMTMCVAGQQHLVFSLNAHVINQIISESYSPIVVVKKSDCKIEILHMTVATINSKIQAYAERYVNKVDRFSELRTAKLVAELESKLGAKLGTEVKIKLYQPDGSPRLC